MNRLRRKIREQIKRNGTIPFKTYMQLCLYDDELGYYRVGTRLGRDGDFFTSAHLGAILGRVLAHRMIAIAPSEGLLNVVEMGAGQGWIAQDFLEYLARNHPAHYDRTRYHFVEQNPSLSGENRKRLGDHKDRVLFHETLDELPEMIWGFVFSNEFFDAFPVHMIARENDQLYEIHLDAGETDYVQLYETPSPEVVREIAELGITVPEGCIAEINTDIGAIYHTLSCRAKQLHMITIDYGYTQDLLYHPDRNRGTLMGYQKHRAYDDVFQMEGEMDLTSHVNFDALIHHGEQNGIHAVYFKNQRNYLMDHGLFDVFRDGQEPTTQEAHQLKTLLLPGQMGDVFKVLVQVKGESS